MGLWSVLGTVAGVAATAATGGAAAPLIPILSSAGQAADAYGAEKKAAKQQTDAYGKSAAVYKPFYDVSGQAANSLAGYLGLPGADFSGGMGGPMTGGIAGPRPVAAPSRIAPALPTGIRFDPANTAAMPPTQTLASFAQRNSPTGRSSYARN